MPPLSRRSAGDVLDPDPRLEVVRAVVRALAEDGGCRGVPQGDTVLAFNMLLDQCQVLGEGAVKARGLRRKQHDEGVAGRLPTAASAEIFVGLFAAGKPT